MTVLRRAALSLALALAAIVPPLAAQTTAFAKLIDRLSEGPGFFPSDNLVSNETSYLHVLGPFRARHLKGGVYLGVGPEQGFSYIAALEPDLAFIIDIRRDNLLLHLLLKAIFATAQNRLEYLCFLYGRPTPPDLYLWTDLSLVSLLNYLDATPVDTALQRANHAKLMATVGSYGVPLSVEDRATLERFHDEFAQSGLDIHYTTRGRTFRLGFPTIRDLYLASDLEGNLGSYLATEDRWRTVRKLERANKVIPVVGDLAGPKAVKSIGRYLEETGRQVSVFYLSNVESYLFRQGQFPAFVENVKSLPATPNAVLVRSWFGRGVPLPGSVPGHLSTQQVHSIARFLAYVKQPGDSATYWGVVSNAAAEDSSAVAPIPPEH